MNVKVCTALNVNLGTQVKGAKRVLAIVRARIPTQAAVKHSSIWQQLPKELYKQNLTCMFKSVPPEAIQIASKAKQGELATCKKNAAGQCELSNPCTMLQGMFTVNKEHAFQIGVSFQGYRVEFIPFDNLLCR